MQLPSSIPFVRCIVLFDREPEKFSMAQCAVLLYDSNWPAGVLPCSPQ